MKKMFSFFSKVYKSIFNFSSRAYDSSKIKVVNDAVVSSFSSASSNSFICKFMSSEPKTNHFFDNSFISKIIRWIYTFAKGIFKKIDNLLQKSCIINGCSYFARNIMNIPLCLFGAFFVFFGLPGIVYMFFEKIEANTLLVNVISLCLGIYLIFIKASFNKTLYTSKFISILEKCFSKDNQFTESLNVQPVSYNKIVFCILCILGLFFGILGLIIPPVYILIGIAAFIGVILVINNFSLGVYITVLCFPFLPTMAIVGLLLLSLVSFAIKLLHDDSFKFTKTGLDLYIILFAVIIGISGITSFDRSTSINIALVYIVFILSYFLFTNTLTTKKQFVTALIMLLSGGIIVSFIGIYQYIFGFSAGNVWIDSDMFSEIDTRVVSTFENPNVLGEYLLIIIPIAIAYFFESGSIKTKLSSFIAAVILVLCMVFTFSRGCWIGMIVSFGVLSLFYDRRYVWAGFILLLFAPMYLPESIIQRFLSVGNTTDTSTSYRVYIWFGTIDMLKDYWLTGIGLGEGAFNVIYPHYSYSAIVAPHSHNLYLQILVENGIVGFVLFSVLMIAFYKNAIHVICRLNRGFMKVCLLAFVSAVTGYLVQGLFDNVWYNYRVFMFFFMTLAFTMQCANIAIKNDARGRGDQLD